MIRLKSLLEQSLYEDDNNITEIPKVLFLGDSYTKSKSSYAYRLIRSKSVDGRVVAWPNINITQLVKLAKRYVNDKYQIVSILFGDIVKQRVEISEFKRELAELEQVTTSKGAQLIIIQNPNSIYNEYSDYLEAIDELNSDSVIVTQNQLNSTNTQTKIVEDWIQSANNLLDIEVPNSDIQDDELPTDNASDSSTDTDIKFKSSSVKTYSVTGNFSDSVLDQAYDLILSFEGFTPIAKKDSDGYCRIGHGSMHITKEDGTVIDIGKPQSGKSCSETYPYNISEEDAHRDLRRLIKDTFLPLTSRFIRQMGGDISKLNDATIAVLTSVVYNYGHMPSELKAGISANDMKLIGTTLTTDFISSGSNPKRRKKEGNYILSSLNSNDDNLWSKAKEYISNKFSKKGNAGATVQFSSNAQKDFSDNIINPNLIDDLRKAAEAAGVTIKIGTAKTGHNINTKSGKRSRHADGLAVDIIEVNGLNWNTKDHAIQIGAYEPLEAFTNELEKLGYALNNEYNMDKAILTFGFKDHNDHMHVSRKS